MPCMHAIAAIAFRHEKPEDYCHGWLTMGSYNATYEFFVQPTRGQEYWEKTQYTRPVPPPVKRRPGRPKKARRKDGNEDSVSNGRLKRSYPAFTCSRCGVEGHNCKGCPQRPPKETQTEETQTEIDMSQSQPVQSQDEVVVVITCFFNLFYTCLSHFKSPSLTISLTYRGLLVAYRNQDCNKKGPISRMHLHLLYGLEFWFRWHSFFRILV